MKPASQLASQPVTFFLSSFWEEKKIIIRRNILKTEKRYPVRIKNSLFLCHKCNILPSYLS